MAVASTKAEKKARPRLAPEKWNELAGVVLLTLALLAGLALASYHPGDPSHLHRPAGAEPAVANWIGPVGAELSALGFGFFGLAALLVPLFLAVGGWRRLRARSAARVTGRGLGVVVVLISAPGLLQLTLGRLPWREGEVEAGGAFGQLLGAALAERLHAAGALLVLLALVVAGSTLVVQSTLGDLLRRARIRIAAAAEVAALERARRRERREKERSRERVRTKHLRRVIEDRHGGGPEAAAAAADALDLPLRVTERSGPGAFSVRRVSAAERAGHALDAVAGEPDTAGGPAAAARAVEPAARGRARAAAPPRDEPPQSALAFAETAPAAGLPPVNLLQLAEDRHHYDENELVRQGEAIRTRCAEFGVEGTIEGISPGPLVTIYEFQPAPGVKVSQIVNLQDDLALALKAESVRIDRVPGRSTLGIEVPNRERGIIRLGPLLADKSFAHAPSKLTLALGRTLHGEPYVADLATMPHLLVAGATGAGKSVGLQSMITSILYKAHKDEVKFILIDPKRIELGVYAAIPHLAAEVVVDMKKAAYALLRMVKEMEDRYRLLAEVHVRSIAYYNRAIHDPEVKRRLALSEDDGGPAADDLKPLPYYVIVIDELADLMMVSTAEVETAIARLAQMARAVGIHLIVATQRPSVDVLTGTIKANFPCRISYATASRHDSRTILDGVGAEQLLGKGDMLFMPPGTSRTMRLHGAYVSEQETAALVRWLKKTQGKPDYVPELLEPLGGDSGAGELGDADDDLYEEAARLVVSEGIASASFLQRRMRVGFSRASRLIDMMERDGLLGPPQGSKPREVLVKPDYYEEIHRR
jgi:S-DNA-T family DNA segregation ATPase FtsK/SpoIIIE